VHTSITSGTLLHTVQLSYFPALNLEIPVHIVGSMHEGRNGH